MTLSALGGVYNPQADQRARARDWPRLLHFLAAFGRSPDA